ncbi:MAG TPA: hypothetical protein VGD37_20090 [Kofleriaceae bacterium]
MTVPGAPDSIPGSISVPDTALAAPPRAAPAATSDPALRTRPAWLSVAQVVLWLLLALPALYQIGLLAEAIAGRVGYPYDLEWMEGGLLHHALRIRMGQGIYVPPNADFIPYLYTPLYPALLALFGGPLGLSYALGRAVSIIGLAGIAAVSIASLASSKARPLGATLAGVVLALGLFAASYPFVEGWYDLVRADTLFLFMVTAGVAGLPLWARSDDGVAGHGKVAAGAAVMALAFFCKQTGIFYVALGGAIVLVINWRRTASYVAMAGLIGLGGSWILNRASGGWFWIYVSEIHRAHDFNQDRFHAAFGHMLWHFPAPTVVIAITLGMVAVTAWRTRALPPAARPFLLWTATYAVSILVGAIGYGTEFAHFNAYMPALLHGALAAGAAVPAALACGRALWGTRPHGDAFGLTCGAAAALALALTCGLARWEPRQYIPTRADVLAGDRLIQRIAAIDGDVWIPSHPWYAELADKTPHVHLMGIRDVTTRQTRTVDRLEDQVRHQAYAAILLDNRDPQFEIPWLTSSYHPALLLPEDERPRVYTGAGHARSGNLLVPESIWLPTLPDAPPAPGKLVFDFEAASWTDGWDRTGTAWGAGPAATALPGEGLVLGATGRRFATSMTGGDTATGSITSPFFTLDGTRLTLRLGGGAASALRVELWVDGKRVRTAGVPPPSGDDLREVAIALGELRGKTARLALVDDDPTGHLTVDDVVLWP